MHYRISTLGLLGLAACGQSERSFSGQLDLASVGRSEATLIATRNGDRIESPIGVDGKFTVALVEGRWAIAFAETQGDRRVFAHLVTGAGATRASTVEVTGGEAFNLGAIRPLAMVAALHVADDNGGSSGGQGSDDPAGDGTTNDDGTPDQGSGDNGGSGGGADDTNVPGDDDGTPDQGSGDAGGDDHAQEGCREVDASTGDISLFASFLVRAEAELDTAGSTDDNPNGDSTDDNSVDPADTDEDDRPDELDEDDDGDGICDDDQPGDGGEDAGVDEGEADLPYDARLEVGDTFVLADAFAEKGQQPAEILSIEMDGGSWRLAEIESGLPFTVDQSDCDHEGNRDQGRDRIFVSWRNGDGSVDVDHLDLRYCGR